MHARVRCTRAPCAQTRTYTDVEGLARTCALQACVLYTQGTQASAITYDAGTMYVTHSTCETHTEHTHVRQRARV